MILTHSRYVPFDQRAERFELLPVMRTDATTRRPIRRAVWCPDCRAHRTIVLDAAAWTPYPGVKPVACAACLFKAEAHS